jgi:hypothetical protein
MKIRKYKMTGKIINEMKIINYLVLILLCCSCTNNPKTGKNLSAVRTTDKETAEEPVPTGKDAAYYKSKGYQIFAEYQVAVKCPATLQDISKRSKEDFDLNYAGHTDDSFYQVMIFKLPAGRADMSKEEEKAFMKDMFSRSQGGKSVVWGDEELPAYLFDDYVQKGLDGRGIAVSRNGKVYAFNVITKGDLNVKFNAFTNNVRFLDKLEATNKVPKSDAATNKVNTKTYTKRGSGAFSINYPHDWEIMENPNSVVCVFVRAPGKNNGESKANFNIIVSNDKASLDTKFEAAQKQCEQFMPEYSLLKKDYINIDGMQGIKALAKSKMQGVNIRTLIYQLKKSDDTVYTVTFTVQSANYDEYVTIFEQIIQSFKTI